ncbi:hypothetical protein QBC40DRAFT_291624 [Triangularia verruculosa]|uniref:Uncharacterized protein n=1 Tax=Triangularia verruculosa TaxID=2587418 RepID=A0AAN6XRJ6_9PEZI|nr:hypothetical protein QBC40DRAFT_291624 [Triangularia verruculosa]
MATQGSSANNMAIQGPSANGFSVFKYNTVDEAVRAAMSQPTLEDRVVHMRIIQKEIQGTNYSSEKLETLLNVLDAEPSITGDYKARKSWTDKLNHFRRGLGLPSARRGKAAINGPASAPASAPASTYSPVDRAGTVSNLLIVCHENTLPGADHKNALPISDNSLPNNNENALPVANGFLLANNGNAQIITNELQVASNGNALPIADGLLFTNNENAQPIAHNGNIINPMEGSHFHGEAGEAGS